MADTRLFKVTRERGKPEYGNRQVAGNKAGGGGYSYHHGRVVRVEAVPEDQIPWEDVTAEFLKGA